MLRERDSIDLLEKQTMRKDSRRYFTKAEDVTKDIVPLPKLALKDRLSSDRFSMKRGSGIAGAVLRDQKQNIANKDVLLTARELPLENLPDPNIQVLKSN